MNVHPMLTAALVLSLPLAQAQYQPRDPYHQDQAQQSQDQDPPSRVARVSVLKGDVSLEPAGVDQFSAAELNYPLTLGDRIYTGNASFSELQTSGLALRMANGADLTVTSLTGSVAQFGLAQGSLRLRTRDLTAEDSAQAVVEIDTPNGAILIQRAGDIRVDSYPQDDSTVVTVTSGRVEITGNNFDQVLSTNQIIRLVGTNPIYGQSVRQLAPDALDQFTSQRERQRDQSIAASQQYVDPGMIGVADLAEYGDWDRTRSAEDFAAVWYPRAVPADWTPYSNGHWAWVAPWGWTWVEAEPWGFAPFHYGRWANFGDRDRPHWGWIPGPPPSAFAGYGPPPRPVYSPALVAFVGGPRLSISIGFGGQSGSGVTAWFPLGPREVYQPWFHASTGYINRVNVTNIYNRNTQEIHNTYINRTTNVYNTSVTNVTYVNRPQATVAIAQRDFAAGGHVGSAGNVHPLRLDAGQRRLLDQAPILPHPLVTPTAASASPHDAPRIVPPNAGRPVFENPRTQPGNNPRNQPSQLPVPQPAPPAPRPGAPTNNDRFGRDTRTQQNPPQQAPANQPQPAHGSFPTLRDHQPTQPAAGAPTQPAPTQTVPTPNRPPSVHPPLQVNPMPAEAAPTAQPGQSAAPIRNVRPVRAPEQLRPLVNQTAPPAPQPSFPQQQRAIQAIDPGRPLGPRQVENIRNNQPAGPHQQLEAVPHPPLAPPAPRRAKPPVPADRGDKNYRHQRPTQPQ